MDAGGEGGSPVEDLEPLSLLAPDPVTDAPNLAAFQQALSATAMPIKAALLDQQRAVCGVGNWVADECLHAAAVHPASVCKRLAQPQVAAVYTAIRDVCAAACAVDADSAQFPGDWLFHVRWGRGNKPGTTTTLPDGRRIAFSTGACPLPLCHAMISTSSVPSLVQLVLCIVAMIS